MADLSGPRASLVIPVRDEDPTILATLVREGRAAGFEVIVVDDGSRLPLPPRLATICLPVPQGYGAALKAGIQRATTSLIVTMDGDGQHQIRDAERLVEFLTDFPEVAMVIGARRLQERQALRWVGRKGLNILATLFAWEWIPDLNSGLRAVRRPLVMPYLSILCDQFSFTTSLTLSLLCDNHVVDWIPIHVLRRQVGRTKVHVLVDGWRTLSYIVWIGGALRTRRLRGWLRRYRLTGWAQPLLRRLRPR